MSFYKTEFSIKVPKMFSTVCVGMGDEKGKGEVMGGKESSDYMRKQYLG